MGPPSTCRAYPQWRAKTVLNFLAFTAFGIHPDQSQTLRLLIIEDEDRLSGILKTKLGVLGFAVDVACSAGDAVAALELVNYDAAVLDLGLPDGDGHDVLAAARRMGVASSG